jgi:hypothetical protein
MAALNTISPEVLQGGLLSLDSQQASAREMTG